QSHTSDLKGRSFSCAVKLHYHHEATLVAERSAVSDFLVIPPSCSRLCANDLHQHSLAAASVEFAVENLLPRAKVELALGDRDNDFTSHHLPLHVSIGVVFAGTVVQISRHGLVRSKLLQPSRIVLVQPRFIVVDEYRSSDMHGIHEYESFSDATFA